jgi:hypothetical protein
LRPAGHPGRASACSNLSVSLVARYQYVKDPIILDQAVKLEEEALNLRPAGHLDRALSCSNLADLLMIQHNFTGDSPSLDKAIELAQEALDLSPAGHTYRAMSCNNLAVLLTIRFGNTGDSDFLHQAIQLHEEALGLTEAGHPSRWRYCWAMAKATGRLPPPLDMDTMLHFLNQVFHASVFDDVHLALAGAGETLLQINASVMSHHQKHAMMKLYGGAVDIVALAAGLALDKSTQLRSILFGSALGPAAFRLAVELDHLTSGLSLLERGRGVIWSQLLHMRDPQLDHVPEQIARELQGLLRINPGFDHALGAEIELQSPLSRQRDMDYSQRNSIQDVIRKIRSLPGLSDFMRGPDVNTLLEVGAESPVVVLIADATGCHALLITSGQTLAHVSMPSVTAQILKDLTFEGLTSQKRGSESPDSDGTERGLVIAKGSSPPHARLAKLWRMVVKPIIRQLGLTVRAATEPILWIN